MTHYQCDNRAATIAHTLRAGQRWSDDFQSQGTAITNGTLYVAARDDLGGQDHRAEVGIFTDQGATQALGTVPVIVPVGGSGIEFTFPTPITVRYGERLYIVIKAKDPMTVYDVDQAAENPSNPDGCFIGRVEGSSPPVFEQQVAPEYAAPTFREVHSASGPGDSIPAGATVRVFCKVYDSTIPSANPAGYWYRIASAPWSGLYYATANLFLNGDSPGGPYSHAVDASVPDC